MRNLLFTALAVAICFAAMAQGTVAITVINKYSKKQLDSLTVELMRGKEIISKTTSDSVGIVKVDAPDSRKYMVKVSRRGYYTQYKPVQLTDYALIELKFWFFRLPVAKSVVNLDGGPNKKDEGVYIRPIKWIKEHSSSLGREKRRSYSRSKKHRRKHS